MRAIPTVLLSVLAVIVAEPVWAHHSFAAEFDATKPVHLEGKVAKMEWINPHAWIHIDVAREDGKVERWMIEGGTPNTLFRRGFTKDSLKPGTVLIVEGYRVKSGALAANGRNITFPDGRTLFLGSTGTGAPKDDFGPKEKKRPEKPKGAESPKQPEKGE